MGMNQHFILLYGARLDKQEFLSNFEPDAWYYELERYTCGEKGETLSIHDQGEHDYPWCYIGYELARMGGYDYDALSLDVKTPNEKTVIDEIKTKLGIDVHGLKLWLFDQWY